jgi:hypothetical protein
MIAWLPFLFLYDMLAGENILKQGSLHLRQKGLVGAAYRSL